MKQLLLTITLICSAHFSFAQAPASMPCAADEMMQTRPELMLRQSQLENLIKLKAATDAKQGPYVLPLVVHIIHNNGNENIPDAQVFSAVEHLNQAFSHAGYYAELGDGANTQIQFCLARRTPDGQLTNGINRIESPLTHLIMESEDQALKDLSRWDPKDYVNVWVVGSITSIASGPGVAGYAYLASAHGESYDGLVCEAAFFGVDPSKDAVFIHELGHYLNLYHTFQGGCHNNDCTSSGDLVCDTPPDQATHTGCSYNSCTTDADDQSSNNPFTIDVGDPTENFMDYSPFPCYRSFTEGQGARMRMAIEMFRSSLLESTGCISPCSIPLTAMITASDTVALTGETVSFTSQTSGATNTEWYVNGVLASTAANFDYQFTDTGTFRVVLKAWNADPNCIEITDQYITVQCNTQPDFAVNAEELTVGDPFICTNNSTGGASYRWYINGVLVGSTPDLSYSFNNTNLYTVRLEATGAYCNASTSKQIIVYTDSPCETTIQATRLAFTPAPTTQIYHSPPAFRADGGMYTVTYIAPRGLVARFDPEGNKLWQTLVNVPYNGVEDMAVLDDGSVMFSHDVHNMFKINENGTLAWAKTLTLPSGSVEFRTIKTGDGVVAYSNGGGSNGIDRLNLIKYKSDGTVAWSKVYSFPEGLEKVGYGAQAGNNNGFWLAGFSLEEGMEIKASGGLVMRFDANGDVLFCKRYTLPNTEEVAFFAIDINENDEFVVSGVENYNFYNEPFKYLVLKGDAQGNVLWTKEENKTYNHDYSHIQNLKSRPAGGYLQMVRYANEAAKWYAWSENGNLEFVEEISQPGYMDNIVKNNNEMVGVVRSSNYAKELFLFKLNQEGKPLKCAGVNYTTSQVLPENMLVSDFPYTLLNITLTPVNENLTTGQYSNSLGQIAFCTTPSPCIEFCDNGLDDDEDGYVDCYDSDCQCFNGADCTPTAPVHNLTGKLAWNTPGNTVNNYGKPIVANLDPENGAVPEILVASKINEAAFASSLFIYNGSGANAAAPDVLPVPEGILHGSGALAAGDLDRDGKPEVIQVCGDQKIRVYSNYQPGANPPMNLVATSTATVKKVGSSPALADFDADGLPEIYADNAVFRLNPGNTSVIKLAEGVGHIGQSLTFSTGSQSVAADFLTETDCNGDPDCNGLELAAGAYIYSVDLDPLDGDGMEVKVQRNLNAMGTGGNYQDGNTYAADVNLDGLLDVVAVSENGQQRGVYVWNKDGLLKFFNLSNQFLSSSYNSACIANVFDDRKLGFQKDLPEIIVAHATEKLTCLNLNAAAQNATSPWWWQQTVNDVSSNATPSAFDFNADGIAEIVFRDEKNLRMMYGDALPLPAGVDANRNWYMLPCESATGSEYPVIADVDNDHAAEIIVTGTDPNEPPSIEYAGKLWVVESATIPWAPARNLWNQNNYFVVHINDDLSIPKHQQANHLEFPNLGSGKHPYNLALTQISTLNANADPFLPVPDARVQVDSSVCEGDQIRVWLTICNEGSSTLPSVYPYTIYLRDPRQTGAVASGSFLTSHHLPVDSCLQTSITIPAAFNESFHVVCGDDGTHALPYALADFPLFAQPECRFENNFANFTLLNPGATLDLGPDLSLCQNSILELKANSGFTRYRWHNGSEETSFTAFGPGKYWVDAWDVCGYRQTDTVVISLNTTSSVELGSDVFICEGATHQLNVQGFESVHWSPTTGLSCADCPTPTASPSDTMTYHVTVANGQCISSDSIRIVPVPAPQISVSVLNGTCLTLATLTASSNDPSAVFQWEDGSISHTFHPASAGTYTVTATNALGCSTTSSAAVSIESDLSMEFQTADIPCSGGLGVIRVTGYGGSGDYTFVWSNGATDAFIETLQAGAYTVTMTDVTGLCSLTGTVSLALTGNLELSIAVENPSCFNASNGTIFATSIDGIAPFSWLWAGGQQDSLISSLPAGIYTVTVTDAVGCTQTAEIALTEPDLLQLLVEAADTLICPGTGASLASAVAGGTPPFNYLWNTGQTEGQLLDAPPGMYVLVATDAHQCTASASVTVSVQPLFEVALDTIFPASGPVKADGGIQLSISNPGEPYTYLWNNGDSNLDLESVLPGNYTLTVTDSQGCTQTFVFTVPFTSTSNSPEKPDWTAAIWPNPTGQGSEAQLMVQSPVAQHLDVQVFDARGVLLSRQWLDAQGKMVSKPLVAPPAAGVYFVMIRGNGNVLCLRWVVE